MRTRRTSSRVSGFRGSPSPLRRRQWCGGGYGIFYNAPALNNVNSGPQQSNAPFVSAQTFNSSLAAPITLNNPFPSANAGAGTLTLSAINRNLPDARAQQWSLNVQRELTHALVLEVGYQGAKEPIFRCCITSISRRPDWAPCPEAGTSSVSSVRQHHLPDLARRFETLTDWWLGWSSA